MSTMLLHGRLLFPTIDFVVENIATSVFKRVAIVRDERRRLIRDGWNLVLSAHKVQGSGDQQSSQSRKAHDR